MGGQYVLTLPPSCPVSSLLPFIPLSFLPSLSLFQSIELIVLQIKLKQGC